jgi:hypothetical protein
MNEFVMAHEVAIRLGAFFSIFVLVSLLQSLYEINPTMLDNAVVTIPDDTAERNNPRIRDHPNRLPYTRK